MDRKSEGQLYRSIIIVIKERNLLIGKIDKIFLGRVVRLERKHRDERKLIMNVNRVKREVIIRKKIMEKFGEALMMRNGK